MFYIYVSIQNENIYNITYKFQYQKTFLSIKYLKAPVFHLKYFIIPRAQQKRAEHSEEKEHETSSVSLHLNGFRTDHISIRNMNYSKNIH